MTPPKDVKHWCAKIRMTRRLVRVVLMEPGVHAGITYDKNSYTRKICNYLHHTSEQNVTALCEHLDESTSKQSDSQGPRI